MQGGHAAEWAVHAGYGFCRQHIQMFDPGFRGRRVRGKEDAGTADAGSDPIGVLDRWFPPQACICMLRSNAEASTLGCCSLLCLSSQLAAHRRGSVLSSMTHSPPPLNQHVCSSLCVRLLLELFWSPDGLADEA